MIFQTQLVKITSDGESAPAPDIAICATLDAISVVGRGSKTAPDVTIEPVVGRDELFVVEAVSLDLDEVMAAADYLLTMAEWDGGAFHVAIANIEETA